jgi:hypothetical protein
MHWWGRQLAALRQFSLASASIVIRVPDEEQLSLSIYNQAIFPNFEGTA